MGECVLSKGVRGGLYTVSALYFELWKKKSAPVLIPVIPFYKMLHIRLRYINSSVKGYIIVCLNTSTSTRSRDDMILLVECNPF